VTHPLFRAFRISACAAIVARFRVRFLASSTGPVRLHSTTSAYSLEKALYDDPFTSEKSP
jgi:hypothetical protein